jgi:transposase InsO family protein
MSLIAKSRKIRSDNGNEFDNNYIHEYCDEVGIKQEVSTTYTPQQNGVVERNNMTLITLASTMIDEYNEWSNLGFGFLDGNTIKGLTYVLSVEHVFSENLTRFITWSQA